MSSSLVEAASCCGGGSAIPSIIAGDDQGQLSALFSYGQIGTDVSASGVWQDRAYSETIETVKLEGAHIYADRWQTGISIPFLKRQKTADESSGLGDIAVNLGYEVLPDWDYSPWRPKGIGFISLVLPTGKSIYESNDPLAMDSRGRGFWALGTGVLLTKNIGVWDLNSSVEIHHAFDKSVSNSQIDGHLSPGNGGVFSLGGGYNLKDFRLGAAISWNYEDPVRTSGSINSEGSIQRFATGSLMVNYLFEKEWSATFSYADQTLFGSPINSSLAKTTLFSLQKRWER